jgi:MFS family permease
MAIVTHDKTITEARLNRIAVSVFFYVAGLTFASWASRIPDIKIKLGLGDAAFGSVLFALPTGLMVSLPLSGYLVTRFGSKKVVTIAALLYPLVLILLGLAAATWQLAAILFIFGLSANLFNISVNTQAVGVEVKYGRSIMASFHGLWSLAGFCGAATGTLMIFLHVLPAYHFCIIFVGAAALVLVARKNAPDKDSGSSARQKLFTRPDNTILKLGIIAFGSMVSEGAMFDWSGIYFQKVLLVPPNLVSFGFGAFMSTMAGGRFAGDVLITKFGVKRMLQVSGIFIAGGLLTAIIFPYFYSSVFGFLLVGFGVSSVVPMVYGLAGKSTKMPPGVAIASVSSIGFLGFFAGPPLIGFIAQATNLRASFALIALLGFGTTIMATFVKTEHT